MVLITCLPLDAEGDNVTKNNVTAIQPVFYTEAITDFCNQFNSSVFLTDSEGKYPV